jgi:DNA-binding transcriptional LysR family regulator
MSANRWLGVEFRHLAALAAVRRTGTFRGAADDLGYVQSAVSQQIARLEQLVGSRLVERTRGTAPITLTSAGELLLEHVDGIMARFQAAQADLAALSNGRAGTLRVGVFQSAATRLLPPIVRHFGERSPRVRILPSEARGDPDFVEQMRRGTLDIAFTELPLEPGPFSVLPLLAEPCTLLVPADWPLAKVSDPPALSEVARLPLIARANWGMLARIRDDLRSTGREPEFVLESDTNSAVQALVAAGIGAAILPRLAVELDHPGTAVIDLGGVLPLRTIGLFRHRERQLPAVLPEFCAVAQSVCSEAFGEARSSAEPREVAA